MTDKRTLTIGVTINLGNYESLRLEVSDTAETREEVDALRHYLSSVLDGYGNNSATARTAIEKYQEHILADGISSDEDLTKSWDDSYNEDIDDSCDEDIDESGDESCDESYEMSCTKSYDNLCDYSVVQPTPGVATSSGIEFIADAFPSDEVNNSANPLHAVSSLQPAPLVNEQETGEFICSKCGASVTKLQRDVSMLFNHKILCKNCMK